MALKWADELSETDPLPVLEPFYILAALELGDPNNGKWLIEHTAKFHALYRQYRRDMTECGRHTLSLPTDRAAVLIQYMIWYDRDSRRLKQGG
jgi:hypothetical protein